MARNCLRINHEGDSIQLFWQRGQANPRPAPSVTFTHPFDEQALADLRWYLEEYLRFPYGLAPDNAAKVEQKLQTWGEQLFELVFRSSEKAREFFQAATYEGLNQCELVITSDSPQVLNLPWELLYSPSDRQFLAPSLAGMSRSLSDYAVRAEMSDLPQDKLNILLVIARPYGEKDIALKTIARPLLESVSHIRQKVNIKVLRPPSFEQGATLSNVVNQVGREVWGDKFSQYRAEQQQQAVLNYLKTQPSLLIWDNFEPVAGFPAGNEPLLNGSERDNLQRFLKDLRGGKSWVLITSRREESWLDCGYRLLDLRGLREQDVEELAAKILETAGVDRKNLPAEYLELLKLLGGHPFSLRVVLPHLKTQTPKQLIEALRQGLDTLDGTPDKVREKSLTVSLDYSFAKLSERARRHLPFLALFSERVGADWLSVFSGNPDDDFGQAYQAVFGKNLQQGDWLELLNEAVQAGILENVGYVIYKIHPALPWYLRQQLSQRHDAKEVSELEKKLLGFYTWLADQCHKDMVSNAQPVSMMLLDDELNLLQNLRLAEQQQDWGAAQAILRTLGEVYMRLGRKPEFKILRQRALSKIGTRLAEARSKGQIALEFWMYLQIEDANEAGQSADLEKAGHIYQEILDELVALNDTSVINKIAAVYHNLGNVTQEKRNFKIAIDYYQKALQIYKNIGDSYSAAKEYNALGLVALEQRNLEKALDYFQKYLQIYEDAGDSYKTANAYQNLGLVAQEQRNFEMAITYYQKALQIRESFQDFHSAASTYYQLGRVAQEQGIVEGATACYRQALQIYEDAEDFYNAGSENLHSSLSY